MTAFFLIVCGALAALCGALWRQRVASRREAYIRDFVLPRGLFDKLIERHPRLTLKDCQLVSQGLRQFFLAHLKSGRRHVSMPSQVVDDLWHELILHTRTYQSVCGHAFGKFLHHTPAVALRSGRAGDEGLRRSWWQACREENINPRLPSRLPLLFALDAKLDIANGFRYVANCEGVRRQGREEGGNATAFCGTDLTARKDGGGCGGGCGGDGGSGGDGCGGGGCGGD